MFGVERFEFFYGEPPETRSHLAPGNICCMETPPLGGAGVLPGEPEFPGGTDAGCVVAPPSGVNAGFKNR